MQIRAFEEADAAGVVALWTACGLVRPWNDPRKDITRKLAVQRELFGCAKINLQIRRDNADAIAFYQRIGFGEDAVVSMGKRLVRDDG